MGTVVFAVLVDAEGCDGCGVCADACPASMFEMRDGKAAVTGHAGDCLGCETCVVTCPKGVVRIDGP